MERPGEQQFGITNVPDSRLRRHRANGWNLLELIDPFAGQQVLDTEVLVKRFLNNQLGTIEGTEENWNTVKLEVSSLSELFDEAALDGENRLGK